MSKNGDGNFVRAFEVLGHHYDDVEDRFRFIVNDDGTLVISWIGHPSVEEIEDILNSIDDESFNADEIILHNVKTREQEIDDKNNEIFEFAKWTLIGFGLFSGLKVLFSKRR